MDRRRTLDRALSRSGACSRSQARSWIEAGRVRVGGRVVRNADAWVDPGRDAISLDGHSVREAERQYLLLHKPVGYLTTRTDPEGRPTVLDLLGSLDTWLAPVGRLDRDTSGLLLLTNDSDLADRVTDPRSHLPKTYVVSTRTPLDETQLAALRAGVDLADGRTLPVEARRLSTRKGRPRIELVLREGRNRQVRRMLKAVGSRVADLERVAVGPLRLGSLRPGEFRPLTPGEVRGLVRALSPPAGGRRGGRRRTPPS